jgi:hypothetical protein
VTVRFECDDATSGVASCPAPVTLSAETSGTVVSGTGRDVAGHTTAAQSAPMRLDFADPGGTIKAKDGIVISILGKLSGTATDTMSGVAGVAVVFRDVLLGGETTMQATVTCTDPTRRSCTWTSRLPRLGAFRATATATDVAGHKKVLGSVNLVVGL